MSSASPARKSSEGSPPAFTAPPRRLHRAWKSLVALAAVLILAAAPVVALAAAESHGTLVSHEGPDIYDWELDLLLDIFIGDNYHSRILAFTECYGGDKMDEFAGDRDTTVLSGSTPGNTTDYGGYHRGLAGGLAPGSDTDTAHAAGVANASAGDTPASAGPNQDIGTGGDGGAILSTHVLVWAGDPNDLDQDDIDDINDNFGGQPNTTVTVLSGDGTGPGVDGAATFDNLVDALEEIGAMMNENEQFILFVTDHGDLDTCESNVSCPPGGCFVNLNMPIPLYDQMLDDLHNVPNLALFTQGPQPILPGQVRVLFNGIGPFDVGHDLQATPLDFDNDGTFDRHEYQLFLDESWVLPGPNTVQLQSGPPLFLPHLSLDSGKISRILTTPPGDVANLRAAGAEVADLSWKPLGGAAGYDLLASATPDLSSGVECVATGLTTTGLDEAVVPAPGSPRHYLVRAYTAAGNGPWGFRSSGQPRVSTVCDGGGRNCEKAIGSVKPDSSTQTNIIFCSPAAECNNDPGNHTARDKASDKICQDQFGDTCDQNNDCGLAANNCCAHKSSGERLLLNSCTNLGDAANECPGDDIKCSCTYTLPNDPRPPFAGFRCSCTCQSASCPRP